MLDRLLVLYLPWFATTYALEVRRVKLSNRILFLQRKHRHRMPDLLDVMKERAEIDEILRRRGDWRG